METLRSFRRLDSSSHCVLRVCVLVCVCCVCVLVLLVCVSGCALRFFFARETNVRRRPRVDAFPVFFFSASSSLVRPRPLDWPRPLHTVLSSIHSVLLKVTRRLASGDGSVLSWLVERCHLVLALRG